MANPKAWMTTAIFTEWFNNCFVPEVEAYMKEKSLNFKVLLIVDNAASHPQLEHPNVQLTTYKFILNKLENESLTVKDVWKQFSIFDCLIHVASASAQIKPRTLNDCWKKIWPAYVTDNTTTQTSTLSDEIINLAHEIGGEIFNTFSHDDIDELLVGDALSDNDIIDLTLDLTVDGVVGLEGDNDEEEKSTPLTGKLIQEGLQLCSKLENHFLINAPNSERASKLQRELQNCMSGYRELYKKNKRILIAQSLITDYIVRKGRERHRTRMKFVKIRGLYSKYLLQRQSLLMMKVIWIYLFGSECCLPNGQAFVAYPPRPMTLHSPTENSLAVLNHKILEANSQVPNVKLGGHQKCLSINRLWHELCDMLRRLVRTTAPGHHDCSIQE
ncbi:tigger transposable element-derived protein 1 [Trichonephila clavipes]|nr:tigger transposable element-derived protein 1 [Trichonephila clavipes]